MVFDELVLHNFGVYRGRQTLRLTPPSADRPVVLLGGLNGAGKTTLLDALQLVLYGRRARCSHRGELGYEEFLKRSVHRGSARDGAAIELAFRVSTAEGESAYRVHRSWRPTGAGVRERLEVHHDGRLDAVLSQGWAEHVEELLPLDIAPLFFFDGERVESLADPARATAVIATAVESLLNLNLLDRLRLDLLVLERRKQSESVDREDQTRIEPLEAALAEAENRRRGTLQLRAGAQARLDQAHKNVRLAEDRFRRDGGELYERRYSLRSRREALLSRLGELRAELVELAAGPLPLRMIRPLLGATLAQGEREEQLRADEQLGQVLADRDKEVVRVLVQHRASARLVAAVEAQLSADRDRRAEALADSASYLELASPAATILRRVLDHELSTAETAARALRSEIDGLAEELTDLDRQVAGVPSDDMMAATLTELDTVRAEFAAAQAALEQAHLEVGAVTRWRDQCESDLRRVLAAKADRASEHADAQRMLTHAARVRDTLVELRSRLVARHASRIEAAVLDSFRRLLRKDSLAHDLYLDPTTFELSLSDSTGRDVPLERLSAGERQLLAVALLWGLARVSGRRLPTVIDTPLGRLDSEHRRHLVQRYFPHASHQVLLLSTDEEIDEGLAALLTPHVGRAYELRYDDASQETTISEGYFWGLSSVA